MKKEKKDIVFVILHYNTMIDTINCVNSINKNIDTCNYAIIIVDNYSPNKTGLQIEEKYKNIKDILVTKTEENLGFAKGNNIGIQIAQLNFDVEFICCLNNDTLLIDNKFYNKINKEYQKSHFGVMGPRIVDINNKTQLYFGKINELHVYEQHLSVLSRTKKGQILNLDNSFKRRTRNKLEKSYIGKIIVRGIRVLKNKPYRTKYNEPIHGSCVIFSPLYLKEFEGFYKETFMYYEEELLFLQTRSKNLNVVYNPSICIKHLEDSATDSICGSDEKKQEFILNCKKDSLAVLIKYMKEKV